MPKTFDIRSHLTSIPSKDQNPQNKTFGLQNIALAIEHSYTFDLLHLQKTNPQKPITWASIYASNI